MTKINLIFNENRNIQKEQSRLERMGLKDELTIVSDEHLLASARPEQMYYDSQRKCGCFWSGVLDNEEELHDNEINPNVGPDYRFREGDHIILIGRSNEVFKLAAKM